MSASWIHKPAVFFGKRLYILFGGIMSIPVWLAASAYMDGMQVHDEEAVATGVTMCFFAGVFTGRYIEETWTLHKKYKPQGLVIALGSFITLCLCWLFIHADFPISGMKAINLLLYWLPFMAMSVAIGMLIKIVRNLAERELREAQSLAAQSETELRLLQSQLSPHFLFNTLNNMYGLSLTQHERVPPLLLKLSDLLRYSVYDASEMFVQLNSEIDYIRNYIEFEKIRLGERLMLETDIQDQGGEKWKIAPMLLIVFIENAFKHSKNTVDDKIAISISLRIWNELVLFSVKNSYNKQETQFDKNSGLGLDNVKKRLELLYPGAYKLDIEEADNTYSVALHLKMKD